MSRVKWGMRNQLIPQQQSIEIVSKDIIWCKHMCLAAVCSRARYQASKALYQLGSCRFFIAVIRHQGELRCSRVTISTATGGR